MVIVVLILIPLLIVLLINIYIIIKSYKSIGKIDNLIFENIDCILVLGAGLIDKVKPTLMLKDRLDKAIEVYKNGLRYKIIMSGDHGRINHNEVGIMKDYAIEKGIPSKDIFMDHAGFCTYDSIYRAKEIFSAKKIIIITQKYHLYRSIYIANFLGIEAYGIKADARIYIKMPYHIVRETFARCKNFFKCLLKCKPKYLGEKISLHQSGDVTND